MSKYERWNLSITIFTAVAAAFIGWQQILINQSLFDLEYSPSVDVHYEAGAEEVQVYNRGRGNLYIVGGSLGEGTTTPASVQEKGQLVTPGGLYYKFFYPGLNLRFASELSGKNELRLPFDLFFTNDSGEKYISENLFYIRKSGQQMLIDVQTNRIKKVPQFENIVIK